MEKKVLVLGASGMLGSIVYRYLQQCNFTEVRGVARNNPYKDPYIHYGDANDIEGFKKLIDELNPTHIVNCIGVIPQNNPTKEMYEYVNFKFPQKILDLNQHRKFIHASTDCVYNGRRIEGRDFNLYNLVDDFYFEESTMPDKDDWYGIYKYNFDYECQYDAVILRGSIIGPTYKNIGSGLFNFAMANKNKEVKGYTNHIWNGNTTLQFAKIAAKVIRENTPNDIYQLGNKQIVSKYELLKMISNEFELNLTVQPFETPEAVDRTLSYSDNFILPTITEQLKEFRLWVSEEKIIIWQ